MKSRELMLRAAQNKKTPRPPIWFMRQAGRFMADYRSLREKYDFLTMVKTPELAIEVTLQPVKKFNMDAAIIFSDILTALEPMGIGLQFSDAKGPELDISATDGLSKLKLYDTEESLSYVLETIRILRRELGDDKALLGFCGAPFTLATYLLEGKHKKTFNTIRKLMVTDPPRLEKILDILAEQMGKYLACQIKAGVDGVQLFDSWAGNIPPDEYEQFVLKYQKKTFISMKEELTSSPEGLEIITKNSFFSILFVKNFTGPMQMMLDAGSDVLSIDESRNLLDVRQELEKNGGSIALQGNLSPYALYHEPKLLVERVQKLCSALHSRGHIINLGHGVFPDVSEDNVALVVDTIKAWKEQNN